MIAMTVGKLAAGIAHEVGNPLSGILGYLSVIRMQQPRNPELIDLILRIEQEVHRIDSIVRGLLELGRPSRGKAQPVDAASSRRAYSCWAPTVTSRSVRVEVEGPPSPWLLAETGPLSQVLINLLLNAAQAMEGKGKIVVRAEQDGAGGRVAVEDEGPGLSPQVKARLFEPFFTSRLPEKARVWDWLCRVTFSRSSGTPGSRRTSRRRCALHHCPADPLSVAWYP